LQCDFTWTPGILPGVHASPGSGRFLKVGFEKRQGFVEIAGKLRQYVRRISIARLFRPVDAGASRVRGSGVALD